MYQDLQGKVAVITGSSRGIGRSIAERLAKEGMQVVVNYHSNSEEAQEVINYIQDQGGQAIAQQGDVSLEDDVQSLLRTALHEFGRLDLWVNNAGVENYQPTERMSLNEWQKVIDINLNGLFLGSMAAIRHFLKNNQYGNVINISSVHERIPWPGFTNYAVSKSGAKMFTKTIALEYSKRKIRVNAIAPGAIDTPINAEKLADATSQQETIDLIPMARIGKTQEVAAAAAWLASQESSYVTGETIFVDGGMTLYPSFAEGKG
ncbi:glucose 1-dehydrogenase [Bombilactobacillus bombi]|uniref:glucose 1-dehydrogenase n=1 Tax=Bombilactobacillus bombi TaxID=1303590 RepID=UPI0015E5E982|nr:glucose 1-dehydrogenase [Bombilactobacillus bombi]MBA1434023.1 glucose 1-dehydrogenase [Bombilactobacillus bombi]